MSNSYALNSMKSHFMCFIRIERWGTCGDCPRSGGEAYPEFCIHTKRYDHNLDIDQLVEQYKRRLPVYNWPGNI